MNETRVELNQFSFSGVITQAIRTKLGLEIHVTQRIANEFDTTFVVVVGNSLLTQPLGLAQGDRVIVINAMAYQLPKEEEKDKENAGQNESQKKNSGEIRCKISSRSQIQALSKENPFLGDELAKDKFCPSN